MTNVTKSNTVAPEAQNTDIPFASIDPGKQGITVGGGDTETIEFTESGQRIVGVLMDVRHMTKPYESNLYEVHNSHGEFSFWGGAILDDRLSKVAVGKIIDITYNGDKKVKGGGDAYKNFTVRYYTLPESFDVATHSLYYDSDKNTIEFMEKGGIVPETITPF